MQLQCKCTDLLTYLLKWYGTSQKDIWQRSLMAAHWKSHKCENLCLDRRLVGLHRQAFGLWCHTQCKLLQNFQLKMLFLLAVTISNISDTHVLFCVSRKCIALSTPLLLVLSSTVCMCLLLMAATDNVGYWLSSHSNLFFCLKLWWPLYV